ncbi:MAG: TAT-variant-translocated molybdopterin oxidoreductase, partial [Pirellulales bacterium]|nr:TAT-variant-translocated molybdopterin oxidoreductase [Pirellulales bacterium]
MSSLEKQREEPLWWHSLDELADTPRFRAFLESEFPAKADPDGINRRRWLQVMGASLVLAAANGCRWEKQDILPMAKRPEGYTPGKTRRFCTAMPLSSTATGLEVTCVDGRPIKIEGNPRHPYSLGATDAIAQAALLELYDPDRNDSVRVEEGKAFKKKTWEEFLAICTKPLAELKKSGGAGFRILSEPDSSPTLAALRARLLKALPKARWYDYEPLGDDNEREGARLAFGRPLRTHLALDKARVILCLDADLLGSHPASVRHARDFAIGRDPQAEPMNRLYVVESGVSLTGAAADHRLPLQSLHIPAFVSMLEHELTAAGKSSHDESSDPVQKFVQVVAGDLLDKNHLSRSAVCIGEVQPPEAHAAVHRINAMLGNVGKGKPITYTQVPDPQKPSNVAAIRELV